MSSSIEQASCGPEPSAWDVHAQCQSAGPARARAGTAAGQVGAVWSTQATVCCSVRHLDRRQARSGCRRCQIMVPPGDLVWVITSRTVASTLRSAISAAAAGLTLRMVSTACMCRGVHFAAFLKRSLFQSKAVSRCSAP